MHFNVIIVSNQLYIAHNVQAIEELKMDLLEYHIALVAINISMITLAQLVNLARSNVINV